jgi:hypothetical protein
MKRVSFSSAALILSAVVTGPTLAQTWNIGSVDYSRLAGFSQAMVIDGEDIIATRTGESTMFPSPASQKGGVFVFRKSGDAWSQVQELIPEEIAIGDRFGQAMALRGNLLAVSAPGANKGCGAIVLFERDENTGWQHQALLNNEGCEMDERLGWSLALGENSLYAGAPGTEESSGALHIFTRDASGQWKADGMLTSGEEGDYFGESVAAGVSGGMVGAPAHGEGAGAA